MDFSAQFKRFRIRYIFMFILPIFGICYFLFRFFGDLLTYDFPAFVTKLYMVKLAMSSLFIGLVAAYTLFILTYNKTSLSEKFDVLKVEFPTISEDVIMTVLFSNLKKQKFATNIELAIRNIKFNSFLMGVKKPEIEKEELRKLVVFFQGL